MMQTTRRDFMKLAGGVIAAGAVAAPAAETQKKKETVGKAETGPKAQSLIWGNLLHLSYNMWCDRRPEAWGHYTPDQLHYIMVSDTLRFDEPLWNDLTQRMAQVGMNMVVIDLGDAVKYESHPEIAVKGAWSPARLKEELARLRGMGLEPIPKLNFSTAHDQWLHDYSRMVSTPMYYKVCGELIDEVIGLFGKPRFFHLGYDEETAGNQAQYTIAIVRQHELWWHDFEFFASAVEKHGVRPWIWSDYAWAHPEEFYEKMPKSVLQSNWYYGLSFDAAKTTAVKTYLDLEKHGFDQVPTGSNWSAAENFGKTVEFCGQKIAKPRLKGFLQTPWKPTLEAFRDHHIQAIEVVGQAISGMKKV